jgi:hypothetical protein
MTMMAGMIRTQCRTGRSSVNTGRHQLSTATIAYTNASDRNTGTVIERHSSLTVAGAAYVMSRPEVSSLLTLCTITRYTAAIRTKPPHRQTAIPAVRPVPAVAPIPALPRPASDSAAGASLQAARPGDDTVPATGEDAVQFMWGTHGETRRSPRPARQPEALTAGRAGLPGACAPAGRDQVLRRARVRAHSAWSPPAGSGRPPSRSPGGPGGTGRRGRNGAGPGLVSRRYTAAPGPQAPSGLHARHAFIASRFGQRLPDDQAAQTRSGGCVIQPPPAAGRGGLVRLELIGSHSVGVLTSARPQAGPGRRQARCP